MSVERPYCTEHKVWYCRAKHKRIAGHRITPWHTVELIRHQPIRYCRIDKAQAARIDYGGRSWEEIEVEMGWAYVNEFGFLQKAR